MCIRDRYNSQNTPLPDSVRHTWMRYNNTAAIYDMHVQEGPLWMRRMLSKMAGWRLRKGNYKFPVEQKLFDLSTCASPARPSPATTPRSTPSCSPRPTHS